MDTEIKQKHQSCRTHLHVVCIKAEKVPIKKKRKNYTVCLVGLPNLLMKSTRVCHLPNEPHLPKTATSAELQRFSYSSLCRCSRLNKRGWSSKSFSFSLFLYFLFFFIFYDRLTKATYKHPFQGLRKHQKI